jgi:hypothetical protein
MAMRWCLDLWENSEQWERRVQRSGQSEGEKGKVT